MDTMMVANGVFFVDERNEVVLCGASEKGCEGLDPPVEIEASGVSQLHPLNFDKNFSSGIAVYQGRNYPHGGGCFLLNVAHFDINNSPRRQITHLIDVNNS
jgi:hypothetical protein